MAHEFSPSEAAIFWFLKAQNGEIEYKNQEELAIMIKIAYPTLKNGLAGLRKKGYLQRGRSRLVLEKQQG